MAQADIRYLDRFGTVDYDFTGASNIAKMTNFTKFIKARDIGEISSYIEYTIVAGDTPDSVSYKLYGTAEYYWMLFLINPELREGHSSWPLTDSEFDIYLDKEYHPYSWLSAEAGSGVYEEFSEPFFLGNIPFDAKYLPHLRVTYSYTYDESGDEFSFFNWPLTNIGIKKYDHDRLGLVIDKPVENSINARALNLSQSYSGDEPVVTLGITHDNTALGFEWRDLCDELARTKLSLAFETVIDSEWNEQGPPTVITESGCIGETDNFSWYDRGIVKFQADRRFSRPEYKNAIHQWYIDEIDIDGYSVNGVLLPQQLKSHWEVMLYGINDQIPALQLPESDNEGFINNTLAFDMLSRVTFFEYERDLNDRRRRIKVPRPDIAGEIARRYYKLIRG